MQHELAIDYRNDAGSREWGPEESGLRSGLPFRGNGRPVRVDGTSSKTPTGLAAGLRIEVVWASDVAWRKPIEVSRREEVCSASLFSTE